MAINNFPPIESADEDGILAIGGNLTVESLLLAYSKGIFPWPHLDEKQAHLLWFSPPERAIIDFDDLKFSKSFNRVINNQSFSTKINHDFSAVITACAQVKRKDQGTWITPEMITAYTELHNQGYAESISIYQNNQLVGGIYGVRINNYFAAESMFHLVDNASKLALYHLVKYLKSEGLSWLDCQVLNPFLEKLGAKEIDRTHFITQLKQSCLDV